jgi:phage shock protein E
MNMIQRIASLILISVTTSVLPVLAAEKSSSEPVVIDVREEAEWKTGHLEGAILIPHERIGEELPKIVSDKKTKIYLYCRTGRRTGLAFDVLKKAGYEDLVNLETVEKASKTLNRPVVK